MIIARRFEWVGRRVWRAAGERHTDHQQRQTLDSRVAKPHSRSSRGTSACKGLAKTAFSMPALERQTSLGSVALLASIEGEEKKVLAEMQALLKLDAPTSAPSLTFELAATIRADRASNEGRGPSLSNSLPPSKAGRGPSLSAPPTR